MPILCASSHNLILPFYNNLNGLEGPSSGISFLGGLKQVVDGHSLESLTDGLYSLLMSFCLDSGPPILIFL